MTPEDDDDPFEGLDEDEYVPPESDVDPEEDLDLDEEPEDETEEEADEDEEVAPDEPDEEGVMRIPPTGAGDEPAEEPDEDPFGGIDEDAYVPPESEVDPEEHLDLDDEQPADEGSDEEEPPEPVAPEPSPAPEPEADQEPPRERRAAGEPPDEDLRIEDILAKDEEEPSEPEPEPAPEAEADEPPDEEEPVPVGPLPAAGDESDGDEAPSEDEGEPPDGPPTPPSGPDREPVTPEDEEPDLPGVGSVLVAGVLDGLGSRRVAWTLLGAALAVAAAAYWRGLSETGWLLRTAFVLTPTLLLPAFLLRFPLERRTGQDRVLATYPPGAGRFLAGRFLAHVLLGLVYLGVALAVVGPVAYYAGPHWAAQIPEHLGVGALVVLTTAALGLLVGTLLGRSGARRAGTVGLVLGGLLYAAPQAVYLLETYVAGTAYAGGSYEAAAVRLLHLSPAVAGTSLLLEPEVFPVVGTALAKAAALPVVGLVSLFLGSLAYLGLQGPGGWRRHRVLVGLFALLVVAGLAVPAALPLTLDRGDPFVERTRSSALDVTVGAEQDLRGATGAGAGGAGADALTQGVSYDGFLTLTFTRDENASSRNLTDVTVTVTSEVLGVDGSDDRGTVTVPGTGDEAREPVDVPVTVDSVPGAVDPADATAFVEVTSDEADLSIVVDDLATATTGTQLVRWAPAAAVVGLALLEAAVLTASRRRL